MRLENPIAEPLAELRVEDDAVRVAPDVEHRAAPDRPVRGFFLPRDDQFGVELGALAFAGPNSLSVSSMSARMILAHASAVSNSCRLTGVWPASSAVALNSLAALDHPGREVADGDRRALCRARAGG